MEHRIVCDAAGEQVGNEGAAPLRRAGPQANKGVREMGERTYDKGLLEEAMDEVLRSARENTMNLSWVHAENAVALAQKAGLDVEGIILINGRYPALVELRALINGALNGTAQVRVTVEFLVDGKDAPELLEAVRKLAAERGAVVVG